MKSIEEKERLLGMDLKSYAEAMREMELTNQSPYVYKEIGEMMRVVIAGKTAYEFSITNALRLPSGEYSLEDGQTYNYAITENNAGQKIIINYLIKSKKYPEGVRIARKMLESFNFFTN